MGLELYLNLHSQPCRAVYIFAKKNNIAFEFKFIDLSTGQQLSEEFGKVNALQLVPAIKDGDFTLGESVAILKYLACKYQVPDHWYPADLQKRARVDEYLAWQHTTIRYQGSRIFMFRSLLPALTGQPIPKDRMDEALEDLRKSIQIFEDKFLQDKLYIAGEKVSLADLVALVELMQPLGSGFDPLEGRPKLIEWRERVKGDVGKELFNEAHEKVMKNTDLTNALDRNSPTLQQLAQKLQKKYK
ncbi:glutathione S-transferase theta-1-like [Carcharodon carcharias]|uniref:glutathione S-transferase theta-1-like n=1 Tax=Carcharodon carcharias TaxID=13397 RepID=UPI001B7EBB52|nr:glutathione S-transferase theta-1-like [Carcharodon carcharias]